MRFTFDEICESQDFEHDAEFVRYEFYCELEARNKELEELVEVALPIVVNYKYFSHLGGNKQAVLVAADWQEKAKKLLSKE